MTYLYTDDTAQYTGDYWATVNRYRLPGTTVDTRRKGVNDGRNYLSRQSFAGGLPSASGASGAFAMILDGAQTNLLANKAWFSFDNEIVALGSGIADPALSGTGWDSAPVHVETIIDNRRVEAADQAPDRRRQGRHVRHGRLVREPGLGPDLRQPRPGRIHVPRRGTAAGGEDSEHRLVVRHQREDRLDRPAVGHLLLALGRPRRGTEQRDVLVCRCSPTRHRAHAGLRDGAGDDGARELRGRLRREGDAAECGRRGVLEGCPGDREGLRRRLPDLSTKAVVMTEATASVWPSP